MTPDPPRNMRPSLPVGGLLSLTMSRRRVLGGVCALAARSLPGCARTPVPVRIGLHPWPANDLYVLAEHLGYYNGDPVRIVDYTSAAQGMQAVRNGVAELYPCTLDEALLLAADLPDLRVVQVLDSSFGADAILAQPDLPSLGALRGRRIGYEASALGAYVLGRGLEIAGLSPVDVIPVSLPVDEHERAFAERRVDAVVTYEPERSRILALGAVVVFDSTQIPDEIVDVLVAHASVVEHQSALLTRVVRGWFLASTQLGTQSDEATTFLAQRMALPRGQVQSAFAGVRLADLAQNRELLVGPAPRLTQVARHLAGAMAATGFLSRTPDLDRLVDSSIIHGISLASGG